MGFVKVTKAVFPVAGLGSRFLPATKASPKEMLPVVDKPLIQFAVEEAAAAGITDMIFINGRNKRAIEDHFDKAYELETELAARNKTDLLELVQGALPRGINFIYIRQAEALGLGHAVLCAEPVVGAEPFAVLLADDLIDAEIPVMRQMTDIANREQYSVIGVMPVPESDVGNYGIVETDALEGRAAQRCFVSQPALSVAIQKLEEELGTQLFERGKAEITVTPVGERIVEQAQKVLEEAARIREIAQAGRNQLVGLFRLGVIYTVAPYLLPDLIPALNERAPQMPLEIEENLTEQLETALKSGRIDAAIIAMPFQPPGVATEFLYEEPFQVVVPQQHRWARRKTIQPSELAGEHTILLNVGHCFRDQVLDACPELNRGDAPVTRTNSLETVRNMVASGLGVSVLPRDALTPKYHSRLVVAVPFAKPVPSRRTAPAHRDSFPRPAAVAAIREAVAACRTKKAA